MMTFRFQELVQLAERRLPDMWDPDSGLFSHKMVIKDSDDVCNIGTNALYSAIALIGLLEHTGSKERVDSTIIEQTLEALHKFCSTSQVDLAVLGCLLWASALTHDPRMPAVVDHIEMSSHVEYASSMQIGLLLTALGKAYERAPSMRGRLAALVTTLREELLGRYSRDARLFRGAKSGSRKRADDSLPRLARRVASDLRTGRITSFASQVYPLLGLATVTRALGLPLPQEATATANRLVERQGSLGQWWWQYSSATGNVVEGYPVYSVHQDAMAFMALAPLHALGAGAYREPLELGLRWLSGDNELGESLIDEQTGLIVRCIQRRGSDADAFGGMSRRNRIESVLASYGMLRPAGTNARRPTLEILRECRSYHLGWLLYAAELARHCGDQPG
jgi:hypothetical protein